MAIDPSALPPIPDGFQIKDTSTPSVSGQSGLPPIPDGFELKVSGDTTEQPKLSAFDYYVKNPAIAAGKAYINDAKDIGNAITHPIDTAKTVIGSLAHPVDTLMNTVKNIPDTIMNHPIQTAAMVLPGSEGAVGLAENAAKGISDATKNTGRYFSRIGSTFKPDAIKNINVSNSGRIANLASDAKSSANSDIQPIQNDINTIKSDTDKSLGSIKESRIVLKKNLQQLNMNLQDAAEKGSVDFQKKLPDFFQANSEAYGNARDNAFEQMAKEGKGITNQEVFDAIQKTKQDISEALIPSDAPALKVIRQLESKYDPSESIENSPILGKDGNPISTTISSKANDFVDLNKLVQDLRNVKSTLSSGASSGRTGFNQEDLAVNYLNHNLGDYIKDKIPTFAQLQKDYSPVMSVMKEAHKIFKPNMGEFNTKTATNFLKQAGTGKLELGQEKVLNAVEGGNKFAPGVGPISQEVKSIGQAQQAIKDQMAQFDMQLRNITGNSNEEIAQKQASIANRKAILQNRLDGLDQRRRKISRLEANKDVIGRLKHAIIGKAADAAGLGSVKTIVR